ncbi:MAG: hypothetical protein PVH79_04000 [Candidatus Bathyarchaeota archaeon]|jgi:DNA repair exonuclease SbcCD ATPase subunit
MIESLEIRGFKSYSTKRTERVIFTKGVNKISGRNAAGKTSLLEAIIFGLYGDIPGVTKQSLIPLGGSTLNVSLALKSPLTGQKATIHREGSLNKEGGFRTTKSYMTVEGEDHSYSLERDIQSRLRELLGIGRNTFLNVVFAKQKEFIEILNPNKTRMDAILGLTTPAEIREEFREAKKMLSERGRISERGTYEERIRNAEGAISDSDDQLGGAITRKTELEDGLMEKREKLWKVKGRVEDLESFLIEFRELEGLNSEIYKLIALRDERQRDLEEIHFTLGEAPEERLEDLRVSMEGSKSTEERLQRLLDQELGMERADVTAEVYRFRHLIDEHTAFKDKGLTICPTCRQEIDYQIIERDLSKWQEELDQNRNRLKSLEKEIETIQGQVKVARDRWIKNDREIAQMESMMHRAQELENALEDIVEKGKENAAKLESETNKILDKAEVDLGATYASLEDAREKLEAELRERREELLELQGEVRSREDRLKDEDRLIEEIKGRIERQKEVLEESQQALDGIKEYEAKIRTLEAIQELYGEYEQRLRENTLAQLEYQTYQYFKRLTDQQAYGACYIDRERYTLEVYPLGESGKIPAWRTGGGHQSLFALAERLALLRVMGFPHLLILDEPTDAVDSQNIPQLLEYVAKSGRELGQVLLVTHHGYGEEEGVNLITIRKVSGDSRVIQEEIEEV